MASSLRLVVYDRTDNRRWPSAGARAAHAADGTTLGSPGLSPAWWAGTWLHRLAGAADATFGAASWDEALAWAAGVASERGSAIGSLQFWGHGGWGFMRMGETRLDVSCLRADHELAARIDGVRAALAGADAVVWFRCCSAFGNAAGLELADVAARRLGCRVAGHTYIIGPLQSGTRSLRPGEAPSWDSSEGVAKDAAGKPVRAKWSGPFEPETISCLRLGFPDA